MRSRRSAYVAVLTVLVLCSAVFGLRSVLHSSIPSVSAKISPTHTPLPAKRPVAKKLVRRLHPAHPAAPMIALTFDDGPNPYYTEQVLVTLRKFGIHATFFVIGRQAAAFPDEIRAEAADGNEIENHTWNHAHLTALSTYDASLEIADTAAEVLFLTGRAPRYLRPPYGTVNQFVRADATSMGEDTVLWNVDPRDWARPGVWAIENNILTNTHDRSIILMHDGGGERDQTVAALQTIIPTLKARGFRFVTMQQLMDPTMPTYFPVQGLHTEGAPRSR